jgi:type IV pilus assembly protein PilY1
MNVSHISHNFTRCLVSGVASLLIFFATLQTDETHADDTDIYTDLDIDGKGKPLIMMTLDYKSNLQNSVCTGSPILDENNDFPNSVYNLDNPCGKLADEGVLNYPPLRSGGNGNYSSLEVFRAILKRVMEEELTVTDLNPKCVLNDDNSVTCSPDTEKPYIAQTKKIRELAEFGLMTTHQENNNCDGPNETNCSNGGYILSKFRDLSGGAGTTDYDAFFSKLSSIPIPITKQSEVVPPESELTQAEIDFLEACQTDYGTQGANPNTGDHQFQGAELFFEFFRYLTGQKIHNGHTGWNDYGTNSTDNLYSKSGSDWIVSAGAPLILPTLPWRGKGGLDPVDSLQCAAGPGWDSQAEDPINPTEYLSPLKNQSGCGTDIVTLNFLFQVSQNDDASNCEIIGPQNASVAQARAAGAMDQIGGSWGNAGKCAINNLDSNAREFGKVLEWLRGVDLGLEPGDLEGDEKPYGDVPGLPGKQNVLSYFFVPTNQAGNVKTTSYAKAGGTGAPIAMDIEDPELSVKSIVNIISGVLSVSASFTAATLPSNVFNRTDLLDQVYLAIFQTNPDGLPDWTGNLKRLNINKTAPNAPFLAGVDTSQPDEIATVPAIDAIDGRIKRDVLTVWTHSEDIPEPPDDVSDFTLGADGRSTIHGGAGGNIPGYRSNYSPGYFNPVAATSESSSRKLFTEPDTYDNGGTPESLRKFEADAVTAEEFLKIGEGGTPGADQTDDQFKEIKIDLWRALMPPEECESYSEVVGAENLDPCPTYNDGTPADQNAGKAALLDVLAWGRGFVGYNSNENSAVKRGWLMNDPLHARPLAVNYGPVKQAGEQLIRMVITTNGGFLHSFREEDGVEEWAFTPRSVTEDQTRLQSLSGTHPYTLDSGVTSLLIDGNSDGKIDPENDDNSNPDIAYLFTGMRRGGKHYYAIDASDYDEPKMLWSISKSDADFAELAMTWSEPTVAFIKYDDEPTGVHALIFGGGYNGDDDDNDLDTGKDERSDADPNFTGSDDDEGNAIFIVNARTGALIWKAVGGTGTDSETVYHQPEMVDSIPSKMFPVNATSPNDIFADRAYVGDTGGVIWRVDFEDADRANWQVTRLANLGRNDDAYKDLTKHDRRFFHSPDIVFSEDASGPFDAVVIASGNRAHPLSDLTDDYLYVIKDRNIASVPDDNELNQEPYTKDNLLDLTSNCLQNDTFENCFSSDVAAATAQFNNGWQIKLTNCTKESDEDVNSTCGEKGLSQPLVLFGNIFYNSYVPPAPAAAGDLVCDFPTGSGESYFIDLQTATANKDLIPTNNDNNTTDPSADFDRSFNLETPGIPSDPVYTGKFSPELLGNGGGEGGNCPEALGILLPNLNIELLCGVGLLKKYWYTTEPE